MAYERVGYSSVYYKDGDSFRRNNLVSIIEQKNQQLDEFETLRELRHTDFKNYAFYKRLLNVYSDSDPSELSSNFDRIRLHDPFIDNPDVAQCTLTYSEASERYSDCSESIYEIMLKDKENVKLIESISGSSEITPTRLSGLIYVANGYFGRATKKGKELLVHQEFADVFDFLIEDYMTERLTSDEFLTKYEHNDICQLIFEYFSPRSYRFDNSNYYNEETLSNMVKQYKHANHGKYVHLDNIRSGILNDISEKARMEEEAIARDELLSSTLAVFNDLVTYDGKIDIYLSKKNITVGTFNKMKDLLGEENPELLEKYVNRSENRSRKFYHKSKEIGNWVVEQVENDTFSLLEFGLKTNFDFNNMVDFIKKERLYENGRVIGKLKSFQKKCKFISKKDFEECEYKVHDKEAKPEHKELVYETLKQHGVPFYTSNMYEALRKVLAGESIIPEE